MSYKSTEEMSIKEARELIAKADELRKELGMGEISAKADLDHSFKEGTKVFIRCVTHYYTGLVQRVTASDIVLSDAAWIADTERFTDALEKGFIDNAEIEPYPNGCVIARGALVDWCLWEHDLPRKQQ